MFVRILLLGVIASLTIGAATTNDAQADALGVTVTLNGAGPLSLSNPATAAVDYDVDGLDETVSYPVPLSVADSRSNGVGWNLTVTSTTFADDAGHVLATTASSITAVSSVCVSGQSCHNARTEIRLPITVPADDVAPTAVKFFDAEPRSGMGRLTVTPTLNLSIPGNTYAGAYTSTLTFAISSSP